MPAAQSALLRRHPLAAAMAPRPVSDPERDTEPEDRTLGADDNADIDIDVDADIDAESEFEFEEGAARAAGCPRPPATSITPTTSASPLNPTT